MKLQFVLLNVSSSFSQRNYWKGINDTDQELLQNNIKLFLDMTTNKFASDCSDLHSWDELLRETIGRITDEKTCLSHSSVTFNKLYIDQIVTIGVSMISQNERSMEAHLVAH